MNMEKYDEAVTTAQEGLKIEPKNVELLSSLVNAKRELNLSSEAVSIYDEIISADPNSAATWRYKKGLFYVSSGNHVLAINEFNKSIESDPNDPKPYYQKGLIFMNIKQLVLAKSLFQKSHPC